jgi:hypothetical protein
VEDGTELRVSAGGGRQAHIWVTVQVRLENCRQKQKEKIPPMKF